MRRVNSKSESLWSEEFAVEAAAEQYVSRRQFSKFLVLTSMVSPHNRVRGETCCAHQ